MGTSTQKQTIENTDTNSEHSLILHNDDYNDFDFVVETLMTVCEHYFEQAYQCALITHHKGKCDVKQGSLEVLRPLKIAIIDRGITATID